MKASALVAFFPSGVLGVFTYIERLATGFAFDEPSRGFLFEAVRWTMVLSVWGYPVIWLGALVLTVIGVLRDWRARYLVSLAILPYFVAALPFLIMFIAPT